MCVSDKENKSWFTPTPRLKGVAHTFRVINEDSTVITKTAADYRLEGESIRHRFQRAQRLRGGLKMLYAVDHNLSLSTDVKQGNSYWSGGFVQLAFSH